MVTECRTARHMASCKCGHVMYVVCSVSFCTVKMGIFNVIWRRKLIPAVVTSISLNCPNNFSSLFVITGICMMLNNGTSLNFRISESLYEVHNSKVSIGMPWLGGLYKWHEFENYLTDLGGLYSMQCPGYLNLGVREFTSSPSKKYCLDYSLLLIVIK